MGFFGNLLGQALGRGGAMLFGAKPETAKSVGDIGGQIGSFLPFSKGGLLPPRPPALKAMKKGGMVKAMPNVVEGQAMMMVAPARPKAKRGKAKRAMKK